MESHEPVLLKLCDGQRTGYYCLPAAMDKGTVKVNLAESDLNIVRWELPSFGCAVQHVEYDQYPKDKVYLIAKKTS